MKTKLVNKLEKIISKKNERKKGFTLVELLVVIAILAVLATVSVVGYMGFARQAKQSNDISLVKQINNYLLGYQAMEGKNTTYSEMREDLINNGIIIDRLEEPYSEGHKYAWDYKNDQLVLLNEDNRIVEPTGRENEVIDKYNFYIPVSSAAEIAEKDGFSYYLTSDFTGTLPTLKSGVDTGTNSGLTVKIESTSTMEISVRTTSGDLLEVNAPNATIHHYDQLNQLKIEAVAANSYHEHGKVVGTATIKEGRFVAEQGSETASLIVEPAAGKEVAVEVKADDAIGVVVAGNDEGKTVIEANTTIPSDKKETTVLTEEQKTVMSHFAGGLGVEASPFLIETQEQFMNIALFNGDPTPRHYLQIADLHMDNALYSVENTISGVYDGGNHKISTTLYFIDTNYMYLFRQINGHTTFKNMHVEMDETPLAILGTADWATSYGASFENITFTAKRDLLNVNVNNFGFCIMNPIYTWDDAYYDDRLNIENNNVDYPKAVYSFKNVVNSVNLQNTGTCAGMLIGSGLYVYAPTQFVVEDCVNYGNIRAAGYAGYLYGNPSYTHDFDGKTYLYPYKENDFKLSNNKNYGIISAPTIAEFMPVHDWNKTTSNGALVTRMSDQAKALSLVDTAGAFTIRDDLTNVNFVVSQDGDQFTVHASTLKEELTYKLFVDVGTEARTLDGTPWTDAHTQAYNEHDSSKYGFANGVKHEVAATFVQGTSDLRAKPLHAYDINTAKAEGIVASNFAFANNEDCVIVVGETTNYVVINTSNSKYINSRASFVVYAYEGSTFVGAKLA